MSFILSKDQLVDIKNLANSYFAKYEEYKKDPNNKMSFADWLDNLYTVDAEKTTEEFERLGRQTHQINGHIAHINSQIENGQEVSEDNKEYDLTSIKDGKRVKETLSKSELNTRLVKNEYDKNSLEDMARVKGLAMQLAAQKHADSLTWRDFFKGPFTYLKAKFFLPSSIKKSCQQRLNMSAASFDSMKEIDEMSEKEFSKVQGMNVDNKSKYDPIIGFDEQTYKATMDKYDVEKSTIVKGNAKENNDANLSFNKESKSKRRLGKQDDPKVKLFYKSDKEIVDEYLEDHDNFNDIIDHNSFNKIGNKYVDTITNEDFEIAQDEFFKGDIKDDELDFDANDAKIFVGDVEEKEDINLEDKQNNLMNDLNELFSNKPSEKSSIKIDNDDLKIVKNKEIE